MCAPQLPRQTCRGDGRGVAGFCRDTSSTTSAAIRDTSVLVLITHGLGALSADAATLRVERRIVKGVPKRSGPVLSWRKDPPSGKNWFLKLSRHSLPASKVCCYFTRACVVISTACGSSEALAPPPAFSRARSWPWKAQPAPSFLFHLHPT